jgi:O-acetyl-ADP-ribose deacetylase (regulator of RNase III)
MTDERIRVVEGDITALDVDAIVNAANEALATGGGVCGAIHRAAGPRLAEACREAAPCPTGDARFTPGYDLPARWVVHAVGPRWHGGKRGEEALLAGCYRKSLELARAHDLETIAFPGISTGIFGYPLAAACDVAVRTVRSFLESSERPRRVILCAFDARTRAEFDRALAQDP